MQVPFLAVKSVVNFEEDPAFANQFEAHFELATRRLASTLVDILRYWGPYGLPGPFNHGGHRDGRVG
jgi:hypothetical protein